MSDDITSSEYCPVQRERRRGKRARRGLAAVRIIMFVVTLKFYLALSIPKLISNIKIIYVFTNSKTLCIQAPRGRNRSSRVGATGRGGARRGGRGGHQRPNIQDLTLR